MTGERRGFAGLERLLAWNALRLWDRDFRSSAASARHVRAAAQLSRWSRQSKVEIDTTELAAIALLVDQRTDVVTRCLARLALTGEPAERLRAATTAGALARRLDGPAWRRPSQIDETLRACTPQALVSAWLRGGRLARRRIQWFWSRARDLRPRLSGDEVVALGVPPGPRVGECLTRLRQLQLDNIVTTERQARAFVTQWVSAPHRDTGVRRRRLEGDPEGRGCEQGMRRPRPRAQTRRGVST
jgi:hypothetical protein